VDELVIFVNDLGLEDDQQRIGDVLQMVRQHRLWVWVGEELYDADGVQIRTFHCGSGYVITDGEAKEAALWEAVREEVTRILRPFATKLPDEETFAVMGATELFG
jgi:hypothetical protein